MKAAGAAAGLSAAAFAGFLYLGSSGSGAEDGQARLKITGEAAGNTNAQLLACTAAQAAIRERLTSLAAVFPFCSGVKVRGEGPEFEVVSFFDLPDPQGIVRRHTYAAMVTRRDGMLAARIVYLE